MERFTPWKMLKFHEKTSQAVGASLNSLAECDTKCPLIGFVQMCERKRDLGGRGCVDSAFPGVVPEFQFPCPAWDLAALLENCWIYLIPATFASLCANLCFSAVDIWQELTLSFLFN